MDLDTIRCSACGLDVEHYEMDKHVGWDCPVLRSHYVHRHVPILRWYRGLCGYTGADPITHNEDAVTCPECINRTWDELGRKR